MYLETETVSALSVGLIECIVDSCMGMREKAREVGIHILSITLVEICQQLGRSAERLTSSQVFPLPSHYRN